MHTDYMLKPRTRPMATYKKTSKRYKEIAKTRAKERTSKIKEWLAMLFIVFICSVGLELLLSLLMSN